MPAERRAQRDARRRRLGQNFLRPDLARELIQGLGLRAGERVVEVGAGPGALTAELVRHEVDVVAVELDPVWAQRLRARFGGTNGRRVRIVHADFLAFELPREPFRVIGSIPFGSTTAILRRLFDDPSVPLVRADLVVQWDVARKRVESPPATLLSTAWAPFWEFRLARRLPARVFQPVPSVDAGLLSVRRRDPPLLPPAMARAYAAFVRKRWPFR